MKIEVEQNEPIQEGKPGAVFVKLIGNDGNTKGLIEVYPVHRPTAENSDDFQVHLYSIISHPRKVDINLVI